MTNLCFDGFGRDEVITTDDAGQWFTPPDVASRLATWARAHHVHRILEPSAGSGALIDAVRGLGVPLNRFNVTAYELDEVYANRLRARNAATLVHHADYLAAPAPPDRFDLALMNPPFEDGADGRFVAKAMDESDRVVALVRLAFLAGKARHDGVWSRCVRGGDFVFRGLAIFSKRPVFVSGRAIGDREDGGSAKTDFCAIKLSRRRENERTEDVPTSVEWW